MEKTNSLIPDIVNTSFNGVVLSCNSRDGGRAAGMETIINGHSNTASEHFWLCHTESKSKRGREKGCKYMYMERVSKGLALQIDSWYTCMQRYEDQTY